MLLILIFCLVSYCIGSISVAIIVCKLAGLPDPRSEGSKNPGATNVMRLGGKRLAALTLLGDALKGFLPVIIIKYFYPEPYIIGPVMLSAFLGHLYPVFFGFQGGKGVATLIGVVFAMSWQVGGLFIATWLLVFMIFRISSLAAIVPAILLAFYTWIVLNVTYAFFVGCMCALLIWRHRTNIQRLKMGIEPQFFSKSKK